MDKEAKKPSFLEEAQRRLCEALKGFVEVVESDPEEMEALNRFLAEVRKELIQSFKNGIEVGSKRAGQPVRQKGQNKRPYPARGRA